VQIANTRLPAFADENPENGILNDIVYASIIIACASFSQAVAGVGFVMVATPFLLAILNVKDTVLITFFLSVICQILIVCRHWRHIHPQMFLNFVVGSVVGAPLGLWLFSVASLSTLKFIIGITLLSIASFALLNLWKNWHTIENTASYRITPESPAVWSARELWNGMTDRKGKTQLFVGSMAGFFGPSIGMPGIPLTVYFSVVNMDKDAARSTTLSFFIIVCLVTLLANYSTGNVSATVFRIAPLLIPAVLAGMVLGNLVFPKIPQRGFQLLLNLIILYSSLKILSEYI
jgi:uncharacterized protein